MGSDSSSSYMLIGPKTCKLGALFLRLVGDSEILRSMTPLGQADLACAIRL